MASIDEGKYLGDWLKFEEDNRYSRTEIVLISGQDLVTGSVLGKITASGKYTIMNPAGIDGSQVSSGILLLDTDASAADAAAVIINRDAIVDTVNLTWKSGITGGQIITGLSELLTLGIVAR